jgi:integrase
MAVRRRTWRTKRGDRREAWVVDYVDKDGDRHIETYDRKKDADARHDTIRVDVRAGVHTASSKSLTIAESADDWIAGVKLKGRERTTLDQYRQHVDLHIVPRIGRDKLASLTPPRMNAFRDELLEQLSRPMARKVLKSVKSILKDAHNRGNVSQNVAIGVSIDPDKRGKRKLKIGVDIPTTDEIKRMIAAAIGRQRPFLITAIFTGLRGSELRGLKWPDVDLKRAELHVRRRADRYNEIGNVKSETSDRTIPIGPLVIGALREWRLACPHSRDDLVFPTGRGHIIRHENIIRQVWVPAQIAAGITVPVIDPKGGILLDGEGRPTHRPKYTGLHALRHFYASWCINRRVDGGLELPPKSVQERLGHASIVITLDTYGHLFPRTDDGAELAAAERVLLG